MKLRASLAELPSPPAGRTGWPWTEEYPHLPETAPDGSSWPRVSIVTPSYNQGQFIEETIRSVLLQSYPNLEYIIIDGGSTDESVTLIQEYEPWLAYCASEPDEGQSDALNKGFQRATGEILAWLNCDDIYLPGALRAAVEFLAEHPQVALVHGGASYLSESGMVSQGRRVEFDPNRPCETIIPQPAAFFRRSAFGAVGGLDIGLHYRMDLDLWIRIAQRYEIRAIPYTLARIRTSLDAKTATENEQTWHELAQIGQKYGIGAVTPEYIRREQAKKHFYRGVELLHLGQEQEARAAAREAIKLNAILAVTLKALVLLAFTFIGAGLFDRLRRWRISIYDRGSDLRSLG